MSFGGSSSTDFDTARGRDWPSVRQFNVFLENRVGALLSVVRRFETTDIRIVSLTVNDLADCAIVRLVVSDPERGLEILEQAKLPYTESDLLVVFLPEGTKQLPQVCKALLAVEMNIDYAYTLLIGEPGRTAVAMHVDSHETGVQTLRSQGFVICTEADLSGGSD